MNFKTLNLCEMCCLGTVDMRYWFLNKSTLLSMILYDSTSPCTHWGCSRPAILSSFCISRQVQFALELYDRKRQKTSFFLHIGLQIECCILSLPTRGNLFISFSLIHGLNHENLVMSCRSPSVVMENQSYLWHDWWVMQICLVPTHLSNCDDNEGYLQYKGSTGLDPQGSESPGDYCNLFCEGE